MTDSFVITSGGKVRWEQCTKFKLLFSYKYLQVFEFYSLDPLEIQGWIKALKESADGRVCTYIDISYKINLNINKA